MISSTIRKAGPYAGTGSPGPFPFTFKVFSAADVQVVYTSTLGAESALSAGYTVSLNVDQENSPGGTVMLTAPLLAGEKLTLLSNVAALQPVQITNGGGFFPAVLNGALDRVTILIQQLFTTVSRAVLLPPSETGLTLPTALQRAYTVLGFGTDGGFKLFAPADFVGAPGGNVESLGLFAAGFRPAIAAATTRVVTSGHTRGEFIHDSALTATDVANYPLAMFQAADGRVFRRNSRDIWIEQFGARSVTDKSFDSAPAVRAAYAYAAFCGNTSPFYAGQSRGAPLVQAGVGRFYIGSHISVRVALEWRGMSSGMELGGAGTIFATEESGFFVERYNTDNFTTISPVSTGGDGTRFRGITFVYVGPNAAKSSIGLQCGIVSKARVDVQNCQFLLYPGNGVYILASNGYGGTVEGEASGSIVSGNLFDNCWGGIANVGADANVQYFWNNTFGGCRFGLYSPQFLAVNVGNNHFKGCGELVHYNGNRYQALPGAEGSWSTVTPGTNPAVWGLVEAGGPAPGSINTWVSGGTYLGGAAVLHDNANARSVFVGNYAEGGQALPVIMLPAMVYGGQFPLSANSTACAIAGEQGYLLTKKILAGSFTGSGVVLDDGGWQVFTAASPAGLRLRPRGLDWALGAGMSDSDIAMQITGYQTTQTFGRTTPVPDTAWFAKGFAFGNLVYAPGSAAPTSGYHAVGERVYNDGTVTSINTVDFWWCSVAGTPGTWVAKA